jgi:hypothetical protein
VFTGPPISPVKTQDFDGSGTTLCSASSQGNSMNIITRIRPEFTICILSVALALATYRNRLLSKELADMSCQKAEATNDAYMTGFRAGQIDGLDHAIEVVQGHR